MPSLILASQSSRRQALLQQLGVNFSVAHANIDETPLANEPPLDYVQRMAQEKAQAIALQYPQAAILAADTSVIIGQSILGKPDTPATAHTMLQQLAGATHQVITAIALYHQGSAHARAIITEVDFGPIDDADIQTYIQTPEPYDKAGAYGIQGHAAQWISAIRGSYYGVMGLPLYETRLLLKQAGLI